MPWPLSQDYNEAIQSPESVFGDPELQGGQAVTTALGMPMPRSGNFADVYEFNGASGARWAIKCFTRALPGLRERYSEIGKHLAQARLPFTVDFEFLLRGIRVQGDWYPVLKMQWVEGPLLNEFVRNNLDRPALLEGLGQIWLRMARALRDANIAHADLQHGNVLLVGKPHKQGSLAVKLIDYDGMWVPALAGKPSGEAGHPCYQHPLRLQQGSYGAAVDRVPLLVVACALRCLVVSGRSLWDRYDTGDNLLFREADLNAPGNSALFRELCELPDPQARMLAVALRKALEGRQEDVPVVDTLVSESKAVMGRVSDAPPTALKAGAPPTASKSRLPFGNSRLAEPARDAPGQRRSVFAWALAAGGVSVAILLLFVLAAGLWWVVPAMTNGDPFIAQQKTEDGHKQPPTTDAKGGKAKVPVVEKPVAPVILPLASASYDSTVKIWDARSGAELRTLRGHKGAVRGVAFARGGQVLASASEDQTLKLWEGQTAKDLHTLRGHTAEVTSVAFAADGAVLASGSNDKTVKLWDARTGQEIRTLRGHTGAVIGVAFAADGAVLASAGVDHTVKLWDVRTGQELRTLRGHSNFVTSAAFARVGPMLASASYDRTVRLSDARTGEELRTLRGHGKEIGSVAFAVDSLTVASASYDHTVRLWDVRTGQQRRDLRGHTDKVVSVAFAADGQMLASASWDQTIKLWDARTGVELRTLRGHTSWVVGVAFAGDAKALADTPSAKVVPEEKKPVQAPALAPHPKDVFPPQLSGKANGLSSTGTMHDCAESAIQLNLSRDFDITRSWLLSFDFFLPDLNNPMGAVFFWGDDRPGLDPIFVRQRGTVLEAVVQDCRNNGGHGLNADLHKDMAEKWLKLTFCYHASSRQIELYLDDRLIRRERCPVLPFADRPMPVWLGGVNADGQRFRGKLKNVRLGNS